MNVDEAWDVLNQELEAYKRLTRRAVCDAMATPIVVERTGPSGTVYQIEIDVLWDSRERGEIRVVGSIDDGSLRAFVPVTAGFLVTSEGEIR
jgi:ribosomal protein S28E/S33